MRVAVIGVGSMGRNHARVYGELPGVELAAVCDSNPALANEAAERFGSTAFTDYLKMLVEVKPDAVSVAVHIGRFVLPHLHLLAALTVLRGNALVSRPCRITIRSWRASCNTTFS